MSAPLSAGSSGGSPSASGRKLSTASTPSSKKQRTIDFTFSQQNSNGHKRPIVPKMQNRNQSVQLIRPVGAKKLLIKNLREYAPQAKREYFTKSREQVMKAVDDVLDDKKPHLPLEKLYRDVEDLVKEGAGEELYGLLKAKLQSYLRDFTKYAIKDGDVTGMGMSYLANALDYWKRWLDKLTTIRSLFNFLDRAVLVKHRSLLTLDRLGIQLFRECVFDDDVIANRIFKDVNKQIMEDRNRHITERPDASPMLVQIVRMLCDVAMYKPFFEDTFIAQSETFFKFVITSTTELGNHIQYCTAVLNKEAERAAALNLEPSTKLRNTKKAEDIIIEDVVKRMHANREEAKALLVSPGLEAPKALYNLLKRKDLQGELRPFWEESIKEKGTSIVSTVNKADDVISTVAIFKKNCDWMTLYCFGDDKDFTLSTRNAFATFINDRNEKHPWGGEGAPMIGQFLAKYVDMLLRGGLKTLPKELLTSNEMRRSTATQPGQQVAVNDDEELDKQLSISLDLFRFIDGKDVFEAFYKQHFARRLLMKRSVSSDAEKSMLTKLKGECGSSFTHNLETMLKDIDVSEEEMNRFTDQQQQRPKLSFSANVLTGATWPTYPETPCNMPPEVLAECEAFEKYYITEHRGRNLKWMNVLAHGLLTANLPNGRKELSVSGFQAVVLLLFNDIKDGDVLSYRLIKEATSLPEQQLKVILQSLACGKVHILKKSPKGKDIDEQDLFSLNNSFKDPRFRIKINQIQLKETAKDEEKVVEKVMEDRQFEMQAAIVRIMKGRKTCPVRQLHSEVIEMLARRGQVDVKEIKRNIDKLVDKDYLERDGENLAYVA